MPHENPWHDPGIERRFVDIEEGQVHVRITREQPESDAPSLVMLHPSPVSSVALVGLLTHLARGRRCFAPDTLGFGDSAAPSQEIPEIEDYADATRRLLDALGLEEVDLYGSHTGAHIALELGLREPSRVRRIILDGIPLFKAEQRRELLEAYAPAMSADDAGAQFTWAWQFVRDQAIYFPYYARDAAHLRGVDMPDEGVLHVMSVEVLKALTTYHLGYRAAFRHDDRARLPALTQRTLATADETDPLNVTLDEAAALLQNGVKALGPSSQDADYLVRKVELLDGFLRTGEVAG